jgi:mRNA interferase RelE/StbE
MLTTELESRLAAANFLPPPGPTRIFFLYHQQFITVYTLRLLRVFVTFRYIVTVGYRVTYTKIALKRLKAMPNNIAKHISEKVNNLAANPYQTHKNATKLKDREGYRLRVGDWRVIYELYDDQLVVMVLDVKLRGGAYT